MQANLKATGQSQTELHIREVEILNACVRLHDMLSILLGSINQILASYNQYHVCSLIATDIHASITNFSVFCKT